MNNDIKVVDIYASWCNPCKVIAPIVDKVCMDMGIRLEKIDIEKHSFVSTQYNVKSVPTIIIERDGKEYKRIVGMVSNFEGTLRVYIQNAIDGK